MADRPGRARGLVRLILRRLVLAAVVAGLVAAPAPRAEDAPAEAPADPGVAALAGLQPLVGTWGPPPPPEGGEPPEWVVHAYVPTVGGMAIRLREAHPPGAPEEAELDGLIWWDPAAERVEFAAVAGRKAGQGRFFHGEYRVLADGAIERIYDVVYRTAADTPGEELGGSRRRFRERYRVEGDVLQATLDWWRDGAWRPFGQGEYTLRRRSAPVTDPTP